MSDFRRFPLPNTRFRVGPKVNGSYGFLTFSGLQGGGLLEIEYLPCAGDGEEVLRAMAPEPFLSSFLAHCSPFPEKQN